MIYIEVKGFKADLYSFNTKTFFIGLALEEENWFYCWQKLFGSFILQKGNEMEKSFWKERDGANPKS